MRNKKTSSELKGQSLIAREDSGVFLQWARSKNSAVIYGIIVKIKKEITSQLVKENDDE
jgi:hypothetical protein